MPLTPTTGQQLAMPTISGGTRTLSASTSLSSAQTTTTGVDISATDLISINSVKFGVITTETLTVQVSTDGGTNYRDYKSYTFAQVNTAAGLHDTFTVKGTHARFLLGNAAAGVGLAVRMFV